jgi:iron(II)-dependent oxidoreductase
VLPPIDGRARKSKNADRPLAVKDGMMQIPAGPFVMGYDKRHPDEGPMHVETIAHLYWIDQFEVTNAAYRRFVKTGGGRPPDHWLGGDFEPGQERLPVAYVTWHDADAYCTWAGKRLPTEAEWEKAARGEADTRIYPWGNEMAGLSRANYGRTGLSGPVRDRPERLLLYPPIISVFKYDNALSPYGLFQMGGNVAEWVADWYDKDYYKTAPDKNPKGPDKGSQKAFRGGGWIDSTPSVRVSQRNGTDPKTSMNWMGVRCARDAKDGDAPAAAPAQPIAP